MARGVARRRQSGPIENSRAILTTAQVSHWLGISMRTVCYWASAGSIPAVKVGRRWRFQRTEIQEWVESKRCGKQG
jgi:excisionase family DNA binding protein